MVLCTMLIFEIGRHILDPKTSCTLICTLSSGHEYISLKLIEESQLTETSRLRRDPEISTTVSVPLNVSSQVSA
jgi:hypothetical protein